MTEHFDPDRAKEWADTYGDLGAEAPMRLAVLPLNILDFWTDPITGESQPFHSYSDEDMLDLAENIRKNGVIEPICVRPMPSNRFQIIAGEHRTKGSRMAGKTTIPAVIRQLSDDEATILMVDSNLKHRKKLLPSDKAKAYRVRLEAMKRRGQRTDLTSGPMGQKWSRDEMAEITGESGRQIQRYIRLTYLLKPLLDMVDTGKFAFQAAVEISYLSKDAQALLLSIMKTEPCKAPSLKQAKQLRAIYDAGELDEDAILAVLVKPQGAQETEIKLSLPTHRFGRFFGPALSQAEILTTIEAALELYAKQQEKKKTTPAST